MKLNCLGRERVQDLEIRKQARYRARKIRNDGFRATDLGSVHAGASFDRYVRNPL